MLTLSDEIMNFIPIKMNEITYNDKCKNILFQSQTQCFLMHIKFSIYFG